MSIAIMTNKKITFIVPANTSMWPYVFRMFQ